MLKLRFLTFTNFGLFEQWYNEMAEKGWQFEKNYFSLIHKFKKADQTKSQYKISLAANEGYLTAFSKEELDDFELMAKDAGWNLLDRSFNMNIYRLDPGASQSLYNDDQDELKILRKGIKGELISMISNVFILLLLVFFSAGGFFSTDIFYSSYYILSFPAGILLFTFAIFSLIDHLVFKTRNKNVSQVADLKFSSFSFSRPYALILILSLALIFLAIFSFLISGSSMGNKRFIYLALIPIFVLGLTIFTVKKIKKTNLKTKEKIALLALAILGIFVFNSISSLTIFSSGGLGLKQYESVGAYDKLALRKSILTCCHYLYEAKDMDLTIEKTQVKNSDLGQVLFSRRLKEARNHPLDGDFVKDLTSDFSYEKTYRIREDDSYLILYNSIVLEVRGNIYDQEIQDQIKEFLEVQRWLGTNSKH
ncbi:MAG: DUF2812 domain-containing protein [Bacillota bacterium]|nr:DUF2812 domain-containing protein [Bacillota bacterium]